MSSWSNFSGEQKISWRVIGRGSNILVSGRGYGGVLILLGGEFSTIQGDEEPDDRSGKRTIRVGAGCSVSKLVSWCTQNSLTGLEFMAGIPGSVGGAVYMNAGAWGKEIGDCLVDSIICGPCWPISACCRIRACFQLQENGAIE